LYTNLIASRLVGFREQCVKAVIIYNDFSLPNALKAFIENNWNVHQAFRSVRIAFVAAGHLKAAAIIDEICKDLTERLILVLTNPPNNQWLDFPDHTLRFERNANDIFLRDAHSMVARFEALPKSWWSILKPWL
jgi:hypothetical protein